MTGRASVEDVAKTLRKVLPEARLHRIPTHPERREILLAVLCVGLKRRYPYSEPELNDVLKDRLAELNADVDHVSCRRFMVDLGFIRRHRAGIRYFLNYPKVESTLSDDAMDAAQGLVEEALAFNRKRRRRLAS